MGGRYQDKGAKVGSSKLPLPILILTNCPSMIEIILAGAVLGLVVEVTFSDSRVAMGEPTFTLVL